MRSLPALFLVALALAGGAGASGTSGLYGRVVRAPTQPVCRQGSPCSAPAANVTLVFTPRAGGRSMRVKTDGRGRYRVALAPGVYRVALAHRPAIGRGLDPRTATVRANRFVRVNFSIDTGIR
jgi:hypothetical protein